MIKVKSFRSNVQLGLENSAEISELNEKFQKVNFTVLSSMTIGYILVAIIIIAIIILTILRLKRFFGNGHRNFTTSRV